MFDCSCASSRVSGLWQGLIRVGGPTWQLAEFAHPVEAARGAWDTAGVRELAWWGWGLEGGGVTRHTRQAGSSAGHGLHSLVLRSGLAQ